MSFLVLLSILSIQSILGQNSGSDALSIPNQELNNLFQGRIHFPNYLKIVGSQYLTDSWYVGNIKLMDKVYYDLPLWYDIYTDDLILMDWQGLGYGMIKLSKEHIEFFEFENRLFINPKYGDYKSFDLKDRFYEVLAEGDVSLLISRSVNIQQKESVGYFERNDTKVLIHSDQIFSFRNKKSFLKAIPAYTKNETVKYIKKHKIRLKFASDSEWSDIIDYINKLIQKEQGES